MTGKNRVAWREGMFLRPQHFQAQERYFDAHIRARVDSVQPYAWGFTSITIDEDLASLGKFGLSARLRSAARWHAVLDSRRAPAAAAARCSGGCARRRGVADPSGGAARGAVEFREAEAASDEARFAVAEQDVPDAFSDDTVTEPIEFGLPNLRFGVTRDQTYGRVTLGHGTGPRGQQQEAYLRRPLHSADTRHCGGRAPHGWPHRHYRTRGTKGRGAGSSRCRSHRMGARKPSPASCFCRSSTAGCRCSGISKRFRRYTRAAVSRLSSAWPGSSPTLIRPDRKPPALPLYDHENPQLASSRCSICSSRCCRRYSSVRPSSCRSNRKARGAYVCTITDHNLFKTGYFYLAVAASVPVEEIRRVFPSVAKIAAVQKMKQIVESALPGVPLRHVPTPPPQIRVLPGHVYFELDRSVRDWRDFATAPGLGLHVAGEWPELRLELWCVKRSNR